jgi:ABC-type nitrate/sulfonate/bicarbonate transport system permease component
MRLSLKGLNYPGLATLVICLALWEGAARANPALMAYFPPVGQILADAVRLIISGDLILHAGATLSRFMKGYLLAAGIAVTLGVILGSSRFIYSLFDALIEFLRPMPSVAIIPVAILFLGIGDPMKVAITTYAAFWPILINTIDGVRNIDRVLIYTARTFGLRRWKILKKIALPAASPYIVTGLRISLAISLILVTTSEMVVGGSGLGFFILDEQRSFRATHMYAGILSVALIGYSLNRLFLTLEGKAMAWHRGLTAKETA